ncbi:hypothetical protein [Actinoplanes sp. NBRC 103695]|uniref:hypothetical protein n=1 Tax=Actinoplanes sp. NBRC 103695 TaxID=3032202 RepID=UPI002552F23E|nr:hypothetical protein [Actinoplanes sp. NBRC 103695]
MTTLTWAVRLLYLQAAGLAVLTAYLVVRLLTTEDVHVGVAVALIVMAALGAAAIVLVARGLSRRARGARGPAIVVQLFVIASGGFLVQTSPAWAGWLLIAFGLLVGVLTMLPASTRALGVD